MRRVLGFLVMALIIYFIITEPSAAAGVVKSVAYTLSDAADSMTTFFNKLA